MSELEDFCCVCVKNHPHLEAINESDGNSITYKEKLFVCTKEQIWHDSYNICKLCVQQLDLAYAFIQTCLRSEELRKEQLKILTEQKNPRQQREFVCDKCDKKFKQKRSLTLHLKKSHKNIVIKEVVKLENVKKEDEEDYFIQENEENLNLNYSSEEEIEIKVKNNKKRNKSNKIRLTCEYCGKLFNRRQHYSSHIRSKHTFEKPYECDLCDAKYATSHSLLVHKRNHNNEKPFVCSSCGKSFVCSGDLYHHGKIHLNKREYKCGSCDKSFNTASILRTHKICMHSDPERWKYVCRYCDKRFPINSSLATHQKRHVGVKEFECHICDKKFFDKGEVSKHLKSHSSERFFKCDLCEGREYKNNYGLKKHLKIIHDIGTIKIVKPEKKFSCHVCPRVFAFKGKLQKHLCTHTGDKPFKCELCKKGFVENYYRKLHLQKKHNVESVD